MKPNRNVVLVTPENYCGIKDWVLKVIKCPKCKHEIPADSNFCNECGIKLKLSITVKKYL